MDARIRCKQSTLPVALTYVGAVVGAGFASGREILQFFAVYGETGLLGSVVAGILFAWFGTEILAMASTSGARDYRSLYRYAFKGHLATALDFLTTMSMVAGLSVVLAGGGVLAAEECGCAPVTGVMVGAAILALVGIGGRQGLLVINSLLTPVFIVGVLTLSLLDGWMFTRIGTGAAGGLKMGPDSQAGWLLSAILYVSYNLLLGMVTLGGLGATLTGPVLRGRRTVLPGMAAVLGGLMLGLLVMGMTGPLIHHLPETLLQELPAVYLARSHGPFVARGYALAVAAAILTTGAAIVFALATRFGEGRRGRMAACLAIVLSLPLAGNGVAALVAGIYPLMGYTGLLLLFLVTWRRLNRRR